MTEGWVREERYLEEAPMDTCVDAECVWLMDDEEAEEQANSEKSTEISPIMECRKIQDDKC